MADKLEGSAIVANTVSGDRIVTGSITTTQLAPSVATFVNEGKPLKIQTITYPGDDTAANTGGGQTIVLSGSGFKQNVQVYINSNAVPSVTYANANAISFTSPALAAATYPVYVINTDDGATAILIPGIQYSGTPTWTTTTPLTTQDASIAWNIQLVATSDSAVSYSLQAGSSLPAGITLAANGLISGTMSSPPTDETTYNFTVVANDLELQDASRAFSVSVTVVALDPYFTYTTLLLHGDGTNNANNHAFVDSSNNNFAITRNGNATQGTFSPFGDNWSVYFDGTGDYLVAGTSTNLALGSGDFTIETFIFLTAINASGVAVWDYRTNGNAPAGIPTFFINSSRIPIYYTGDGSNFTAIITGSAAVSLNMWNHIALVRSGSTVTMYLNGISIGSATQSTNLGIQTFSINDPQGSYGGMGYISNFRIVKGTALYTSAFTPPTQPLTSVSNTSLLTCQSNAFVDKGPNRFAITRNGDVKVSKFDPFKPYKAVPASYGVYFDGSGDQLTIGNNAAFELGSGDFSYEAWVYALRATNTYSQGILSYGIVDNLGASTCSLDIAGATGYLSLAYATGSAYTIADNAVFPLNQWVHVVACRTGSTISLFKNGVRVATATTSATVGTGGTFSIAGQWYANEAARQLHGHISNARVLKGASAYDATQSTIIVPTAPLNNITNTQLLTCQSTTLIDNSTNAFTIIRNGDARPTDLNPFTTTFVSEKYNTANVGGSGYFDGSGDWLSFGAQSAFNCGTSTDFCMEAWVYRIGSNMHIWSAHQAAVADGFYFTTAGFNVYSGGGGGAGITSLSKAVPEYAWSHCVLTRQNDRLRYFLNGELIGTSTSSVQVNTDGRAVGINGGVNFTGDAGYIAESRFIKGAVPIAYNTAVTTTNTQIFIPPSAPVTTTSQNANSSQVIALVNFTNAGILDSVGKNVLETVGDARVNTSVKKFGTGSMYFDGNGDVLSIVDDEMHRLTSGDFTIECWVYPTANGALYDSGFASYGAASTLAGWFFGMSGTNTGGTLNRLIWSVNYAASGGAPVYGNAGLQLNTWTHAAVTKVGTTINLFINGVLDKSATVSATPTTSASYKLYIGAASYDPTGTQRSLTGYIDDLRITKGVARYRYSFTPPTKTFNDGDGNLATPTSDVLVGDQVNLPVFPYTTLLLHGDGTNNANNHAFVDSSTNNFAITRNGNTTQGTFSPFSPTGWSAYFDGSGDYVSFGDVLDIGSSNFTFECFVNFNSFASGSYNAIFSKYGADYQYQLLWDVANNRWFWNINSTVSGNSTVYYNDSLRVGEWYHLAFIKNGTSYSLYRNGVLIGTQTISGDIAGGTRPFTLGMTFGGSNNALYPFHGYISNFRALVGTILYTSNFTPPTTPLTAIANTQLLTVQSNRFIDNSTNAYSPTITGDTSIQAFSPFAPSVEYTANTHGGSAYFDGSGDYLSLADNAAFDVGSGNFTFEFWMYTSVTGSDMYIFGQSNSMGSTATVSYYLYKTSGNKLTLGITNGVSLYAATSTNNLPVNAWVHIACVRDGNTLRNYINGVQDGTADVTGVTAVNSSTQLAIGRLGEYNTSLYSGYISNFRMVVGTCLYTGGTSFTPPTAPLTAVANTQLLCNFTNAGILDSTGKNVLETVADAKVNTAIKKYGTGSMYFDGTGDQLTAYSTAQNLNALSSGDFTIEGWINTSTLAPAASYACIVGMQNYSGSTGWGIWQLNQTITVFFNAGSSTVTTGNVLTATGTWYHIAVTRSNGSVHVFINGTLAAGPTSISFSDSTTTPLTVGGISTATGWNANYPFYGYIDDLRITKGIARYVTNFTPPTAAFLNK